jgi:hypothetical protein
MTDPLDRFSAALAGEYDGQVALPQVTRMRLAEGLTRRRTRRSGWRLILAIPLLTLLGGTALAATGRLPRSLAALAPLVQWLEGDGAPSGHSPTSIPRWARGTPPSATRPDEPTPATPPSAASEQKKTNVRSLADLAEVEVPLVRPVPESRPASSGSVSSGSVSSRGTPAARPPRSEPGLATYAAAQRAQFRSADYATAVRLYEDYLGDAPAGTLVAEARYNRSLCLIRLGRITEARPALDAFARGAFGDYRKMEAKRLLRALENP